MSRRLAVAALAACVGFVAHTTAKCEDRPAILTDSEVQAAVTRTPESVEAWEARQPSLVGWLRGRLGKAPASGAPGWAMAKPSNERIAHR